MSEKIEIPDRRLTRRDYYAWAGRQPKARTELVDGDVVAMAPERYVHVQAKNLAWLALRNAILAAGVPCQAIGDGLAVEVGEDTVYQPDALVNCGDSPAARALAAPAPLIVVEVSSPSTERDDTVETFRDYFRVPTIRHYLLLNPEKRLLLHHRKDEAGQIMSTILGSGPLRLDPPGITIQVEDLFPPG